MVVRERGMAETEVMELGVGIPQIKGCCQWVLISAMSITGIKRLHMSHKECNPRLTKNHLPRLSLVHWEVVLNDLPMPLPPLPSHMGGAQNALVVGPSAPMAP
ncbi:hypothetical protein PS1_023234 [Malus domestica]